MIKNESFFSIIVAFNTKINIHKEVSCILSEIE